MTSTLTPPTTTDLGRDARVLPLDTGTVVRSRGWARAGLAAGLLGLVTFVVAGGVYASEASLIDNAKVVDEIDQALWTVFAYQVLGVASAAALVIFAVGLRRRLDQQEPAGSLAPAVAAIGLVMTAVMCLVGSGICTELFHELRHASETDPDTIAANLGIFNTMGWVWAGAGLATGSVALAARRGSVGKALGRGSVAATALIVLTQVTPFQYLALLPAALWLVGAGVAFSREGREA